MATFILSLIGILFTTTILVVVIRKFRKFDELTKAQERKIQDQVDELKQFTGRVSHDLRSPLAVVISSLEAHSITGSSRGVDYLAMARRSGLLALDLIENLLNFANAGGHSDITEITSVQKVFEEAKDTFLTSTMNKNIQLTFECDPQIIIHCEEALFFSMIENLIDNAQKYMGDAEIRRIDVSAEEKNNEILISIKDTGPGIPVELQSKVFDPFTRGRNNDIEGFGLGLATVRKIITAHGGTIHLESEVGKGCCFQIKFPTLVTDTSSVTLT
jgi:signal transduction histidine kinase